MNEGMLTILILGAEFGGLLLLILMVIMFLILRRKRSDKKYVAEFITSYKNDMPTRIEDFKNRLESHFYIVGEDADEVLNKISATETRLHKRILNMYLGNNRACLSDIRNDVASLNERWLDTMSNSLANASETLSKPEVNGQMPDDYDDLKEENATMRKELADAMKSMEEMLKEYSLLYAERDDKNETMERLSSEYDDMKTKKESHDK